MISSGFMKSLDVFINNFLEATCIGAELTFKVFPVFMNKFDVLIQIDFEATGITTNLTLSIFHLFVDSFDVPTQRVFCR